MGNKKMFIFVAKLDGKTIANGTTFDAKNNQTIIETYDKDMTASGYKKEKYKKVTNRDRRVTITTVEYTKEDA